ncbi:MAG: dTMP kinase [Chitinophagaceae bacterium]|nr:dTMP kinase [Chitinophagaceae bacterium]
MKSNVFIAIEGTDGSGKSTQAKLLAEKMSANGHRVHLTFEPTNRKIGSLLRNILKGTEKADQTTIAGLFLADRLDHLLNEDDGLVKKMADGYTVITDRYYFSSYAYHGVYVDMDWVIACNEMCARILKPDMNIFVDVPTDECMRRIVANRENAELYETNENLKKVRDNYIKAFGKLKDKEQIVTINGNRQIDDVATKIWEKCSELLK